MAAEAVVPFGFAFIRSGYRHVLVARTGWVCLVERSSGSGSVHYEVVVLRVRRARVLPDGTVRPAAEEYPPTARWGREGWTYTSRAGARVVFEALAAAQGKMTPRVAQARCEAARRERVHKSGWSGAEPRRAARGAELLAVPPAPEG